MFEIGFGEMLLVCVVALLVLGPERLPGAVRQVARGVGKARAMAQAASRELQRELPLEELRRELDAGLPPAPVPGHVSPTTREQAP